MDDLGKQFGAFVKKVEATFRDLPVLVANEAVNFFQDSFNRQAWVGEAQEPWKPLKDKREVGRAILVKRARLKRSIRRIRASWQTGIVVGTDVPYAGVHNDGFRGVETVRAHHRIASRRVATRYKKNNRAGKGSFTKIRGKGHEVKSFSRMMNIPRRRFIGNSPYLNARIDRLIVTRLNRL